MDLLPSTSELINFFKHGIVIFGNKGEIYACNKSFEDLIGLSKEQIKGKSVFDLFNEEVAIFFYKRKPESYLKEKIYKISGWVKLGTNKTRYLSVQKRPVFINKEYNGLFVAILDLTKYQKEAFKFSEEKKELIELRDELEDERDIIASERDMLTLSKSEITHQKKKLETERDKVEDERDMAAAQRDMMAIQKGEIEHKKEIIEKQRNEIEDQRDLASAKRDQLALQNATILYQKKEIEDKNESITASISYAQRIQKAMMPTLEEIREVLPESFIFLRPRDIVSGDFYWYYTSGPTVIIAAVDCTGHGVPGAFMSMIGNDLLYDIVAGKKILDADIILDEMHNGVVRALKQEDSQNEDGMDMTLCVIHQDKNVVEFAGAKNPLVYIQNNELLTIKGDHFTIGGMQGKDYRRKFTKHTIDIDSLTMFYIFSDGFQDQFGGDKGRKFMIKHLKNIFFEIHSKELQLQKEILENRFEHWKGDQYAQVDDVLVIGFRIRPES